jgi:hypothetical protein
MGDFLLVCKIRQGNEQPGFIEHYTFGKIMARMENIV